MDMQEINTTAHLRARNVGVATLLLGPVFCVLGGLVSRVYNQGAGFWFFLFGFLYGIVILVALGLGIFGLIKSRQADAPPEATNMSISGVLLTLLGLGFLLLIWGSFLVLPCGIFGC